MGIGAAAAMARPQGQVLSSPGPLLVAEEGEGERLNGEGADGDQEADEDDEGTTKISMDRLSLMIQFNMRGSLTSLDGLRGAAGGSRRDLRGPEQVSPSGTRPGMSYAALIEPTRCLPPQQSTRVDGGQLPRRPGQRVSDRPPQVRARDQPPAEHPALVQPPAHEPCALHKGRVRRVQEVASPRFARL